MKLLAKGNLKIFPLIVLFGPVFLLSPQSAHAGSSDSSWSNTGAPASEVAQDRSVTSDASIPVGLGARPDHVPYEILCPMNYSSCFSECTGRETRVPLVDLTLLCNEISKINKTKRVGRIDTFCPLKGVLCDLAACVKADPDKSVERKGEAEKVADSLTCDPSKKPSKCEKSGLDWIVTLAKRAPAAYKLILGSGSVVGEMLGLALPLEQVACTIACFVEPLVPKSCPKVEITPPTP